MSTLAGSKPSSEEFSATNVRRNTPTMASSTVHTATWATTSERRSHGPRIAVTPRAGPPCSASAGLPRTASRPGRRPKSKPVVSAIPSVPSSTGVSTAMPQTASCGWAAASPRTPSCLSSRGADARARDPFGAGRPPRRPARPRAGGQRPGGRSRRGRRRGPRPRGRACRRAGGPAASRRPTRWCGRAPSGWSPASPRPPTSDLHAGS